MNDLISREPTLSGQNSSLRWPSGLLGMIVLVVALESVVHSKLDLVSDWISFTWRYTSTTGLSSARNSRIIVLGDSLVKGGVLPPLIEKSTGATTYNLSMHGGTAPSSYFLLKRLLKSGGRPQIALVDFHPNLLAVSPRSNGDWSDLLNLSEAIDLGCETRDPLFVVQTWLNQAFPSYQHREQIRAGLQAAFRNEVGSAERYNEALKQTFERNQGTRLLPVKTQTGQPLPKFSAEGGANWKPHPANLIYLKRLFHLAEASKLKVVWLLPPTSPVWNRRRQAMHAERPYERFVEAMLQEFPKLTVIDGRNARYPNPAFKDLTHLNAAGAWEYSLALGSILGTALHSRPQAPESKSRWIDLPAYQGLSIDPSYQAVDESQFAAKPNPQRIRQ